MNNKDDSTLARVYFNFGSRLPPLVDYGVYLVIALAGRIGSQQLARSLGARVAFVLYLIVVTILLVSWAVTWRQIVTVTADGIVLRHGRTSDRLVRYDEISGVVDSRPNTIAVELLSGERVQLARARGKKGRAQLNRLWQQVSTRTKVAPANALT